VAKTIRNWGPLFNLLYDVGEAVCASDGGFLPIAFSACYFLIHGAESWLTDRTVDQLYIHND
jgi:hypothetical protein